MVTMAVPIGTGITEATMNKLFVRAMDLWTINYPQFADYCRAQPEQWSMPDELDPSFVQSLGFRMVDIPESRDTQPWESAELVGRKNGSTYYAEWIYPDLPNAAEIKRLSIAEKRWEVEVSGVEFGGKNYPSDRSSQQVISTMFFMAQASPSYAVNFKSLDGFVQLSNSDIIALGMAIHNHVQGAFQRESELMEIEGATYLDW
jgi:hypothetical protein